jgi:hypothetical protein
VHAGIRVLVDVPAYWTQPRDFWISPALTLDLEFKHNL